MSRLGWGIVGLGAMGERFAQALGAGGGELAGVCSRDRARARAFAAAHGLPAPAAHAELEGLLAQPRVEAVFVASVNARHAADALAALAAGKHVLVEKPLALAVADARAMIDRATAARLALGVGFQFRHHPLHRELTARLRRDGGGQPLLIEALWGIEADPATEPEWQRDPGRAGFGSLAGLGSHLIDLCLWIGGAEVTAVSALQERPHGAALDTGTVALLELSGGGHAQLTCSRRLPHAADGIRVHAPACRLEASGTFGGADRGRLAVVRDGVRHLLAPVLQPGESGDLYAREIRAFERAVATGAPPPASGAEALHGVEVMCALARSAARREVVSPRAQLA